MSKITKFKNIAWLMLMVPGITLAKSTTTTPTVTPYTVSGSITAVIGLINTVLDWALMITGIIAIIMVIYGGIMYMLAAGDEKRALS